MTVRLQRRDQSCPSNENQGPAASTSALTLVSPSAEGPELVPLRLVGVVRDRDGDPIPGASLDWFPVADDAALDPDGDVSSARAVADAGRAAEPSGSALTGDRGSFDVMADDSDEHLRVVVRAAGYVPLDVRLVPLQGLPPILSPITRSGRTPLAVRPGAGNVVESWCEFVLDAEELPAVRGRI